MADYDYIDTLGVIVPDTATTRADVVAEWQSVFGADLVTTPETPQASSSLCKPRSVTLLHATMRSWLTRSILTLLAGCS